MSGGNKRRRLLDDSEASSSASASSNEVASITSASSSASASAVGDGVVPMMAMAGPPPVTPPPPASQQQQQQQQRQGQAPLSDPPSIKRSPFPPSSSSTPSSSSSSSSSSSEHQPAARARPFASAATMGTTLFHILCCLFALLAAAPPSGTGGGSTPCCASAQELSGADARPEPDASRQINTTYMYEHTRTHTHRVDVPAFRFILRPVPETFADDDALEVLEVAQDVARSYLGRALERAAAVAVTVEDVELDYRGWFSYSRRRRRRLRFDEEERHLQGRADYAVIESALPVGGTVTFASSNPDASVPTQRDVYLLLTSAFFPEGVGGGDNNNNNDDGGGGDGDGGGGGGGGLASALVGRLGYSPSLTAAFFAVVEQEEQEQEEEEELAEVTDAPTSAPTPVTKVGDEDEQVAVADEAGTIVISPLPPNSTSVAPVQQQPPNDVDDEMPSTGEEEDNLLATQSVEGEGTAGDAPNSNTNNNTAALATGIVLGCLAVVVMGAYYVRSRRRYQLKMREVQNSGGKHGDMSKDLDQGEEEEYDEEQGGQPPSVGGPIMVTPQKSKAKAKSNSDGGVDVVDDDGASHHTAPMTPMSPEASPSKSSPPVTTPTAAAAATTEAASDGADANEIVDDLTRDEAELEHLRRQKELDQSWLSDGLQQPSATGVPQAPDAGELAAAVGATAAAAALVATGAKARNARHEDEDGDDSSESDSHADSSTGEAATVSSLAAVSLTPSDASALHGHHNNTFTIMKDQLVPSGGGDPFGEAGHESQKGGAGAISHQVPVPSINFSSFKRKEKNIHLRPNCLTVEGVVGGDAAAIAPEPEDDNNDGDEDVREEEALLLQDDKSQKEDSKKGKDEDLPMGMSVDETGASDDGQHVPSSNDESMFIVSSPSPDEANNGKISPSLLDATPLNPRLKLVGPKILISTKPSQKSSSKLSGVPPPISEDKVASAPDPSAPMSISPLLPIPVPLKDVGRETSLDRPVDFDTPSWTPQDDENLSSSSSVCSDNDPFVTSDNMEVNDEEFLMDSSPKKGTTYQMMPISDSSFDYEGLGSASSAIGSAFGKGLRHATKKKETGGEDDNSSTWGGDSLL